MIPREKVVELVDAHARLDEPTKTAIWIKKDASVVWLLEVIPSMADDDNAHEPIYFNPGAAFRFPLALVAGNQKSIEQALRTSRDLADAVAAGEVMLGGKEADSLIELARAQAAA